MYKTCSFANKYENNNINIAMWQMSACIYRPSLLYYFVNITEETYLSPCST